MMNKNKKLEPKKRFKEFQNNDAWEKRKLKTLLEYEQPTKYIVSSTDYNDNYNIPVLTAGQSFILGYTNETEGIYEASREAPVIIFDDFTTASHYVDFAFKIKSSAMKLLTLKDSEDDFYFMYNILKNINYAPQSHERHWISKFSNFNVFIPRTDEQKKIGEFFSELDRNIKLHRHRLEKMKELKTAFLFEMFPAEGEDKPTRRFKGFTNAWEQREFLDSIEHVIDFRGRTPKKLGMDWSDNGYLALSALNVKNGYIDQTVAAHYGDEILYKKWMSGRELIKGQVLFTTEAPMGNVAQVPDNKGYILSQRTIAFQVNKKIITDDFLAVLLRSPNVFNVLSTLSSGGTAKGVSQKSLVGLKMIVPLEINEQNKISDFLNLLDNTIALHQRKLEKLQNIKKAFLNEMFVGGE